MKKNLTMALVVLSMMFAVMAFANAMSQELLKVNIPFAFQAGKATLPAGEYLVEIERLSNASALGTAVVIRTKDGTTHQIVTARPIAGANGQATLTFNKYANRYFLSNVESYGLGCELSKSKAEKEIAAKAHTSQAVSVAAE